MIMKTVEPSEAIDYVLSATFGSGIVAAQKRREDFATTLEMQLTGLAVDPEDRSYADRLLDDHWGSRRGSLIRRIKQKNQRTKREVIIGSGFHAATYAACRVAAGFAKPIVVDQAEHVGGIYATTKRPVFYLNSSNRPGGPGFIGDLQAQPNYLPCAPIQPANVSAADFQTNADLAWVIRMTLAQNAEVIPGFKIEDFLMRKNFETGYKSCPTLIGPDGEEILAARVIDARGLGYPNDQSTANGGTILTFPDFMKRMDSPWPLRGVRRVAVIGGGDAGRVSVEQLLGIGPQPNMSMALDRVEMVDWFGRYLPNTPRDWRDQARTRYLPIAKFLKSGTVGTRRLRIFNRRATPLSLVDQAFVDGRAYDLVVLATGWEEAVTPLNLQTADGMSAYGLVARGGGRLFKIGPNARLDFNEAEQDDGLDRPTNRDSMARLGPKTAALAAALPEPGEVGNGDRLQS